MKKLLTTIHKSFRARVLFVFVLALVVSFLFVGISIVFQRMIIIEDISVETALTDSDSYVMLMEEFLDTVGKQIFILSKVSNYISNNRINDLLEKAVENNPVVEALYILDSSGTVLQLKQSPLYSERNSEVIGNNLSYLWLFTSSQENEGVVWSDKYISPLTRDVTIGAASTYNNRTIIAEISLFQLIENLKKKKKQGFVETWVLDQNGNLIVDTESAEKSGEINLSILSLAEKYKNDRKNMPRRIRVRNKSYYIGAVESTKLKWIFVTRLPAGIFENPNTKAAILEIVVLFAVSFIVSVFIIIFLLKKLNNTVGSLILKARAVTHDDTALDWPDFGITEFNELSQSLKIMTKKVQSREQKLKSLNEVLEIKVEKRTKELEVRNEELANTIKELKQIQNELTRSESLALLGKMVAGVAHELNTPLGNSILALSSIELQHNSLKKNIEQGLTRADLNNYVAETEEGLVIAQRNLEKAADLVRSFKQVANDQSNNFRRNFVLDQMLEDLLLTLRPTFKRSRHKVSLELQDGIMMESYPGVLGQIITNLINNALFHAWDEEQEGIIKITSEKRNDKVRITVSDNGNGIPREYHKKIFDPFFTTKREKGGTGLGLKIVLNGVENILGGDLSFQSSLKNGTSFFLDIPLVAPDLEVKE